MSIETESILMKLTRAINEKNFEDEDDLEDFVDQFMLKYNEEINRGRFDKESYDYLALAEKTNNPDEAIEYAKKALQADPYLLDAELVIAYIKSKTAEDLKKYLEEIIARGEKQLAERNISKKDDEGDFYLIFETRAYMRVRKEYLEVLVKQGRYRNAIKEAEELLRLNEKDNMGVRYDLMALYCLLEEEDKMKALWEKYPEDSAFILLPFITLYYKMENTTKMKTYIKKLTELIEGVPLALEMILADNQEVISKAARIGKYIPLSLEEVIAAYAGASYLYKPMIGFIKEVYNEVIS